jgi:hypothetical protein
MLAVLHSIFNDLVYQFSVVARRTKHWVGGGAGTASSRCHRAFQFAVQLLHLSRRKGSEAIQNMIKLVM